MSPLSVISTRSLRGRGPAAWWIFSPLALGTVVAVLVGIALMGAITGPATSNAAAQDQNTAAGGCTITGPPSTPPIANSAGPVGSPGGAGDPGDVNGVHLNAEQVQNAQIIVAVGKAMHAPVKAMAVALAVAYQESKLTATATAGNGVGVGLFLQTSATYPGVNRPDPAAAASAFYRRLLHLAVFKPVSSIGEIATAMGEDSASSTADYVKQAGWATAVAALLTTGTPSAAGGVAVNCAGGAGDNTTFDPGNIISDEVFYKTGSMTVGQIRSFIDLQNQACPDSNRWCLRNLRLTTPAVPADRFCAAYPGGVGQDAATVIAAFSKACGINPQVMLTTLQKESQGLTRTDPNANSYRAAWGWNCPDTGPGGTANCDPGAAGFFNQGYQMAKQWAKYRQRIPTGAYPYQVGTTVTILWNVAESGCGGGPVTIANVATASLYVYTPYQPNAASLAAYPDTGDKCSSYGNRNFFYLFRRYFGPTGGGAPVTNPAAVGGTVGGPIAVTGPVITLPPKAGVSGTITAPTVPVATAIIAGLAWLGEPYSWGGGSPAGPTLGICGPNGAENDCNITGFDCSGLMLYLWAQVGIGLTHFSQDQWAAGTHLPYSQAQPGDMIGYPGHIALYLGLIRGVPYMLEAPESGEYVHITPVRNNPGDPHYPTVSRVWAGR